MPPNQAARGRFQVMFIGEPEALRRSFAQVDRESVEFNRRVDQTRGRLARFGIGLFGALTAIGVAARDIGQAAADAQVSDARLQAQMRALGVSYRHHIPQIQGEVQRLSHLAGIDDEDLQDAFTTILRTTGNVTQSLHLLQTTTDLARGKHLGTAQAAMIVARVAGGNVGILKRYGIQIDKDASSAQALATLSRRFEGQGKAYGETAQGAADRYHVATENLSEAVGAHLLPAITNMALFGLRVVGWTGRTIGKVDDTYRAVRDWITATANNAIGQITAIPQRFEDGGKWIVARIQDGAQAVEHLIGDAATWMLQQQIQMIKSLFSPKLWFGIAGAMIKGIVVSIGGLLVDKLIGLLGGLEKLLGHLFKDPALGGQIVGGGTFGKNDLARWLTEALLITHHFSAGNLKALYGRAMQESGGNPRAINLWDSNAKAGHPSKGLLQTIDSTFNTYKLPGYGDIWNPVDNAIAAIRYMFAVYGHIVGPSNSGYAAGGDMITRGPFRFLAGEKGPERIQIRPVQPRTIVLEQPRVDSVRDAHALAYQVAFLTA